MESSERRAWWIVAAMVASLLLLPLILGGCRTPSAEAHQHERD